MILYLKRELRFIAITWLTTLDNNVGVGKYSQCQILSAERVGARIWGWEEGNPAFQGRDILIHLYLKESEKNLHIFLNKVTIDKKTAWAV